MCNVHRPHNRSGSCTCSRSFHYPKPPLRNLDLQYLHMKEKITYFTSINSNSKLLVYWPSIISFGYGNNLDIVIVNIYSFALFQLSSTVIKTLIKSVFYFLTWRKGFRRHSWTVTSGPMCLRFLQSYAPKYICLHNSELLQRAHCSISIKKKNRTKTNCHPLA